MKKPLIFFCLLIWGGEHLKAQEGELFVGGSLGLSITSNSSTFGDEELTVSTTNWSIAPEVGYFITDEFLIGLGLGFSGTSMDDGSGSSTSSGNTWSIGAYGRRVWDLGRDLELFAGLNLAYGQALLDVGFPAVSTDTSGVPMADPTASTTLDFNVFSASANLGLMYRVGKRWILMSSLGLIDLQLGTSTTNYGDAKVSYTNFNTTFSGQGPVFNIGIYYLLRD